MRLPHVFSRLPHVFSNNYCMRLPHATICNLSWKLVIPFIFQVNKSCDMHECVFSDFQDQICASTPSHSPTVPKKRLKMATFKKGKNQSLQLIEASLWQKGDYAIPSSTSTPMRRKKSRRSLWAMGKRPSRPPAWGGTKKRRGTSLITEERVVRSRNATPLEGFLTRSTKPVKSYSKKEQWVSMTSRFQTQWKRQRSGNDGLSCRDGA